MSKKTKKNVKKVAVWKKNYGNSLVAMKFNPYSMTFHKMEFNGTREEKIKWLKKWFDEETAIEITENSLTKFPAFMVEG